MPYRRCDVNCKIKSPQPGHYDVSQKESCLAYENYNKDYVRRTYDCKVDPEQPKIFEGWNDDFIRVKTNKTKVTGISRQLVEQTIYDPRDVNNQSIPFKCYNHPPFTPITFIIDDIPEIDKSNIFIAREDGADYFFEDASGERFLLRIEPNTYVNPIYLISN